MSNKIFCTKLLQWYCNYAVTYWLLGCVLLYIRGVFPCLMSDCMFIWTLYRDYSMQIKLGTQGVTSWRWCLIGTIYQHCSFQSWHVHVFNLTLISTICNKGNWKSVHLHTVHQANKEQEPQEGGGSFVSLALYTRWTISFTVIQRRK